MQSFCENILGKLKLENQMLELLVQNLRRLDENESADNQGVFNTLGKVSICAFV